MSFTEQRLVRVLIVEDSPSIMEFLTYVLNSDPQIRVVGTAIDGEEALAAAQRVKPDVITMDIHMPKVNGFEATRSIMENCPTPIVIVSGSLSINEAATSFRAIEAGALAVVARPNGIGHPQHESTAKELVGTVKLMSEVKVVKRWPRSTRVVAPAPIRETQSMPSGAFFARVVAIGASTGGPLALQTIFAGLPKDFPLPMLVVQHMAPGFVHGFVEWLSRSTHFPIRVAVQGESLLAGQAYVAPDDFHMGVHGSNSIFLTGDDRENGMRPAASFLFRSIHSAFGGKAVGVLLTGMGIDGAEELKRMKDAGALTIAQDEESSVVHGMPGQAIKIGAAKLVLPPEGIARALTAVAIKL